MTAATSAIRAGGIRACRRRAAAGDRRAADVSCLCAGRGPAAQRSPTATRFCCGRASMLRPRCVISTEKRATAFAAVPTMLIALLAEPGAAGRDFSSLALVGSGGAPMPHEVALKVEGLLGQRVRSGWGMTETRPSARARRIDVTRARPDRRAAAEGRDAHRRAGRPARVLPAGEVGEIAVRGPNVTSGYWNQPELSAQSFADGFFLTGDIGAWTGRAVHPGGPQEAHDHLGRLQRVSGDDREQHLRACRGRRGDRDRRAGRVSRRGGQGVRQTARRARGADA